VADPLNASRFTARSNLVGVITNGTAVLGLGNIGALASKPVMEGKAVLFKKFAGVDVFDIEINETDPDKLVDIIASLESTFGGINLEDIKAPECFEVERKLRERMKIPVFHDDQHGTAITVAAAFINGLGGGQGHPPGEGGHLRCRCSRLTCLDLMVHLGLPLENVWVTDIEGVVYQGRTVLMDPAKARFAQPTDARTLHEVIAGADVFSACPLACRTWWRMAARPLILALANPAPEILPEEAHAVRDDVVMATGRSDYPNQVNNVLCFPISSAARWMWCHHHHPRNGSGRGVRHCRPGRRRAERSRRRRLWQLRPVLRPAIPDSQTVRPAPDRAHCPGRGQGSDGQRRGHPADCQPRRLHRTAAAVCLPLRQLHEAAVCRRQEAGTRWRQNPHRVTEGEDERVLRAVQVIVDEKLARPILVGRPEVLLARIENFGLRLRLGEDVEVTNPEYDERFHQYWTSYWE
jgi:malate dehydrogenase (oxaloacetate-decarboxylating)(NADP+)